MFPAGTRQEHMKVSGESNVKAFCKDYVEKVEIMFILATVASVLVILSLVSIWYFQVANFFIKKTDYLLQLQFGVNFYNDS